MTKSAGSAWPREGAHIQQPLRAETSASSPALPTRLSQDNVTAMTLTDPWTSDDDTDCGYYDTPFGNIWCPGDEPQ